MRTPPNTPASEQPDSIEQQLAEQQEHLEQLQYNLQQRTAQVAELSQTIEQLRGSLSWRLSAPIRLVERQIHRLKNSYKLLKLLWNTHGGFKGGWKKTQQILHNEGLKGVLIRLRNRRQHQRSQAQPHYADINLDKYHAELSPRVDPTQQLEQVDLSQYDVVSFDVFDTALIRLFDEPHGVFAQLGAGQNDNEFKTRRIHAEANARLAKPTQKDIALSDIYAQLHPDNPAAQQQALQAELQAELDYCVVNPVVYDFYKRALAQGKKVYFVSDMYLPKAHIAQLLAGQGYTDYEQLYVSAEDDLVKGDGSRFIDLKQQWGDQRVLHIGDNFVSDYQAPTDQGFDAIHYQTPHDFYTQDPVVGTLYPHLKEASSVGLDFVLGVYRCWKYSPEARRSSLWADIGFLFGGPLLYLFGHYIQQRTLNTPQAPLCFLARDGLIIKQVYDALFKLPLQRTEYVLASRRAMTFPLFALESVQDATHPLLNMYSVVHEQATATEIIERLGYTDLTALQQDLAALQGDSHLTNQAQVQAALAAHHPALRAKALLELQGLEHYLDQLQLLDSEQSATAPVLIDVGWLGTIQDSLNALMAQIRPKVHFNGLYLGVLPTAKAPEDKHGVLFDAQHQQHYHTLSSFIEFIELLTAAPTPGVLRFDTSTEQVVWNTDLNTEEKNRIRVAKELHQGIMGYVSQMQRLDPAKRPPLRVDDVVTLLSVLPQYASPQVIATLSQIKHAPLPSNAYTHSIFDF